MTSYLLVLSAAVALLLIGAIRDAGAQTPAPSRSRGIAAVTRYRETARKEPGPAGDAVYVVTHVDVIPPRKDDGLAALKQLGGDARGSAGNVRFEVRKFRDALGPMTGALYDERLFKAVD